MYARPRDVGGIFLPESMEVNREMDLFGKWTKPGRLDVSPTITQVFNGAGPGCPGRLFWSPNTSTWAVQFLV